MAFSGSRAAEANTIDAAEAFWQGPWKIAITQGGRELTEGRGTLRIGWPGSPGKAQETIPIRKDWLLAAILLTILGSRVPAVLSQGRRNTKGDYSAGGYPGLP